jgi:hypothetical protein
VVLLSTESLPPSPLASLSRLSTSEFNSVVVLGPNLASVVALLPSPSFLLLLLLLLVEIPFLMVGVVGVVMAFVEIMVGSLGFRIVAVTVVAVVVKVVTVAMRVMLSLSSLLISLLIGLLVVSMLMALVELVVVMVVVVVVVVIDVPVCVAYTVQRAIVLGYTHGACLL